MLHGTQSMGTVFWVYATHTRIHTKHTHGHWGPSLHSSLKIWTGGAWPITFEPIKGEVLEQTRIKGGVAIVWSSYRFHWIRWHGLWGCGIFSFKRTRLEPNYIKKNNNNFVRILMPLSRVWPKGHQNYDLCIWCNIGFVLRSLKKWAVGINSITQRNYLIGNSFSAHTRRFWLFNFELIYERLLFTLRDLFLKKKNVLKSFEAKKIRHFKDNIHLFSPISPLYDCSVESL